MTNLNLKAAHGTSYAGILNYAGEDLHGMQAAGIANITVGNVRGLQMVGIFNHAKTLRGVQLGLVNYSESVESGVPIGFLSFVRKGHHAFESSANESLYGVTSVKAGTRRVYNILQLGVGIVLVGRCLVGAWVLWWMSEKIDLAIEGQSYHINEGQWFTSGTNVLSKASANLSWNLAEHLTIFVGPAFNVAVSNIKKEKGQTIDAVGHWQSYRDQA